MLIKKEHEYKILPKLPYLKMLNNFTFKYKANYVTLKNMVSKVQEHSTLLISFRIPLF
jgi:hypothetical protein